MKYQLPITSERLDFQPLTMDDTMAWASFFTDNPGLKYVAITEPLDPIEESQKWIERQLERYQDSGWGHLKLIEKTTGQLVGNAGLILRPNNGIELLEVAYSILPTYWGKGYASEAASSLKEYIRDKQLSDRAISIIHKENIGSQKVATKNGMKPGVEGEYMGMPVCTWEVIF
ncbi:MAG: GNAT family N-acetyltransferase [Roseivirga sp.]|nr:GNAT family N-acetyltransferase [Roseivirga sp.]